MYTLTVPTMINGRTFRKEKTLAALQRAGADRVALALQEEHGYAFSSPATRKLLGKLTDYFESHGIDVIAWGNSLGHDGSPTAERGKYTPLRCFGKGDTRAFCPLDPDLIRDLCTWVKNVAAVGVKTILLDDDLRLGYRGGLGCLCPRHRQKLAAALGEDLPADELYRRIFSGGENPTRTTWLRVQGESMEALAAALRAALDEVAPEVRLGFCASPGAWGNEGWYAPRLAQILAGNTRPLLRTIGAPYWCTHWQGMTPGKVVEIQRRQLAEMKKYPDIEVMTEGDTYPRPRRECPAAYLECYDTILRAEGGGDGILKYMLDYVSDADYETGYLERAEANAPLYRQIDALFAGKHTIGVRPYTDMGQLTTAVLDIRRKDLLSEVQDTLFSPSLDFATENTLPVTYGEAGVRVIFGEDARRLPREELIHGAILDLTAARILTDRGIDVGIAEVSSALPGTPREFFPAEDQAVALPGGVPVGNLRLRAGARLLSEFRYEDGAAVPGTLTYENAAGERFLILPFDGWDAKRAGGCWLSSYARRRAVTAVLPWLGKTVLPVTADGNYPYLYMLTARDGGRVSVGLWNLFPDRIDGLRLRLAARAASLRFVATEGHTEGDILILDRPLYPYEFAGVEITFA